MSNLVHNAFCIQRYANNSGFIGSILKFKNHVQTAREYPDFNIDFRSFDNGLKQLYE